MSERIKIVHPDSVLLYKSGTFYKSFGKDVYILEAIFGYNSQTVNQNIITCGFPISAEKKVRIKLEERKINCRFAN